MRMTMTPATATLMSIGPPPGFKPLPLKTSDNDNDNEHENKEKEKEPEPVAQAQPESKPESSFDVNTVLDNFLLGELKKTEKIKAKQSGSTNSVSEFDDPKFKALWEGLVGQRVDNGRKLDWSLINLIMYQSALNYDNIDIDKETPQSLLSKLGLSLVE